ncbi:olfactory receptor 1E16-like [Gastrophryne carolinensis]
MSRKTNLTSNFILLGFSDLHYNRFALFSIILVIYALTWIGNVLLLTSIRLSSQLHTPMYYFLGNLSVVDISFSTVTVPKLLSSFPHGVISICFLCCFLQMFFFLALGSTEILILAIMAFDRYVAICSPLRYILVMNTRVRVLLTIGCWGGGSLHSLLYSYTMSQLKYCEDRLIHHFFCDVTKLIGLSCSSTSLVELLIYTEGSMFVVTPFSFVVVSYMFIARAIVKLKTTTSQRKAFSSCSSHLMVISLFYVTIIFIHLRPSSNYSSQYDGLVSMGYTVLSPMLNPYIYSLRNRVVRMALMKGKQHSDK